MNTNDSEKRIRTARRMLRIADDLLNNVLIVVLLLLLLFGGYSLWDSKQVYTAAGSEQYEIYKPTKEDTLSFEELRHINPEVIGWLTVFGTAIDYPLTQCEDNTKYLNTDAKGEYSMSGALYLDASCAKDFSDYNTIIHGHHMEASAMFGDLSKFTDKKFFDEHMYGEVYANGRPYGVVFFSFSLVDAYDSEVYQTNVSGRDEQKYLKVLTKDAMYVRNAGQENAEHLVVLSTCSSDMTNGRYILAGYLTDQLYPNLYTSEDGTTEVRQFKTITTTMKKVPLLVWLVLILILLLIILLLVEVVLKKKQYCRKGGKDTHDSSE